MAKKPFPFSVCKECCTPSEGGGGTESNCGIEYHDLGYIEWDICDAFGLPKAQTFSDYPLGMHTIAWDNGNDYSYGVFVRSNYNAVVSAYLYVQDQIYYCEAFWDEDLQKEVFEDWVKISYTKNDIDNKIGDIDSALDELHNYAQALIGGAK